MKRLLIVLFALAVLVGCSAEAVEPITEKVSMVEVTEMKRDVVEKTYISIGEVIPNKQIDLTVNGKIEDILVEVGDEVIMSQNLLVLEDDLQNNYDRTESQLRTIRDNLRIQLMAARDDLEKQKMLLASGAISQDAYDRVLDNVANLENSYNDAVIAYNEQLETFDNNRVVESPIDGMIASIHVKEGQTINNQVALSVIDHKKTYVKTSISGDLKHFLNKGDPVRLLFDDQVIESQIHRINEIPNNQTKLFELWVETDDTLIIGDYVEIEYILTQREGILVPIQSLVRANEMVYIFTLDNEQVNKKVVTTGLTKGPWIEIVGQNQIETVVTKGQMTLRDKETVKIVE